ncbi:UDP-N-acetylglucosamine 2-epimerase [uncultured archaeon]|nr:UDP-N-acetylglucosamine 2-epimerase [uncultured archaeon]
MRIGILTGTRPDIIKMAPLYWEAAARGHEAVLIHTGQHYSDHLFAGVYESMDLPKPAHLLETGACASPAMSVGKMMLQLDELLRTKEKKLDILLTHGDTLTSMAGSLAAYLNTVAVGHVEAGLRTFSREPFPEQLDTRCSDAASDLYFAATETNRKNLLSEGFARGRIYMVGNTVVDAARWAAKKENRKGSPAESFFKEHGVDFSKPTIYYSIHRRETTMSRERFSAAARAAMKLAESGYSVVWSIRPGTKAALKAHGLDGELAKHPNLHPIEEIPSYPFIMFLMSKCRLVCTDSGSMQEEAAALHVPCVTVRYVTDRPESVEAGANVLAPPKSADEIVQVVAQAEKNHAKMAKAPNPYGDGNSSKLILDAIEKWEGKLVAWEHEKGNKL